MTRMTKRQKTNLDRKAYNAIYHLQKAKIIDGDEALSLSLEIALYSDLEDMQKFVNTLQQRGVDGGIPKIPSHGAVNKYFKKYNIRCVGDDGIETNPVELHRWLIYQKANGQFNMIFVTPNN